MFTSIQRRGNTPLPDVPNITTSVGGYLGAPLHIRAGFFSDRMCMTSLSDFLWKCGLYHCSDLKFHPPINEYWSSFCIGVGYFQSRVWPDATFLLRKISCLPCHKIVSMDLPLESTMDCYHNIELAFILWTWTIDSSFSWQHNYVLLLS